MAIAENAVRGLGPAHASSSASTSAAQHVRRAAALLRTAVTAIKSLGLADAVTLAPLFADAARVAEAGTLRCAQVAGDEGARRFGGERTAASLFSSQARTSLTKAKASLDAVEKLRNAPVAEQAFWRGDLSLDQAAVIAPVATQAPDAATSLVESAGRSSVKELKAEAARTLRRRRDEKAVDENERRLHVRRYCRTWAEAGGAVRLEALLGPKDGASVLAALERESLRLNREARRTGRNAEPDNLRADALVSLVSGGPRQEGVEPGFRDAAATRGAGRGSDGAGGGGAGGAGGGAGGAGGGAGDGGTGRQAGACACGRQGGPTRLGAPHVLVRVDAGALQRGSVAGDEICEIAGVGPVSLRIARELLCEGFLTLLVTDGVDVRTVTSTTRTVPARIEKALVFRDVHCVVPGCGATERLEIDHWRTDFAWRGPTELANLCRLCPAHHAMKTRTGWQLGGGPGRWWWLPPKTVDELARRHGAGVRKEAIQRSP